MQLNFQTFINYNVKLFIEQEDESDVTAPKGRKTKR